MKTFIVERNLPGMTARHLAAVRHALREAVRRLPPGAGPVRYLGSTYLPGQSRCICVFEAPSAEAVRRINDTAQVPFTRIDEALEVPDLEEEA